jgi:hypothetical protein
MALQHYLEAGYLEIDNGASDRALKPVAIGRKNSYDAVPSPGARPDLWSVMQEDNGSKLFLKQF